MSGAKLNNVFTPQNLWEPGLPAMASAHSEYLPADTPLSLASQLPHNFRLLANLWLTTETVGASQLAMASCQSIHPPPDTPPSLASQLPQCPGRS
jgi:hypothetical protein